MRVKHLAVGRIKSVYGTEGKVKIICLTEFPARFESNLVLRVSPNLSQAKKLIVEKVEFQDKEIILKFINIDSREQAESLKGRILEIPFEEAVTLDEGSYWQFQILGLKVLTTDHVYLGKVEDILKTGANDVYVVRSPESGKEILIPAIQDVVKTVDLEKGLLVIEPLPGLIEGS